MNRQQVEMLLRGAEALVLIPDDGCGRDLLVVCADEDERESALRAGGEPVGPMTATSALDAGADWIFATDFDC